tara:strand:+ start:452 stop:1714 length:1263 start_codon:yes stop_codon:yes gene_type:complete
MGTKISALTETGSAPTGAYYPLEYDNANYKISTETLRDSLGGKYVADWAQSHGGVTVANGATMTITHNLGTTDICVSAFANDSASDVDADGLDSVIDADPGGFTYGVFITSIIDENSFVLQLADNGYVACSSSGSAIATLWSPGGVPKYIKVVVLSAGSGGDSIVMLPPSTSEDASGAGVTLNLTDYSIPAGAKQLIVGCWVGAAQGTSTISIGSTSAVLYIGGTSRADGDGDSVRNLNQGIYPINQADNTIYIKLTSTASMSHLGKFQIFGYITSAGSGGDSEISFRADRNGSPQGITTSTETQVAFTNEVFDLGGKFDTSTYRFTPGAGRYFLTASMEIETASPSSGYLSIRKNGTSIVKMENVLSSTSNPIRLTVNVVAQANSTDYFDVTVYHNRVSASPIDLNGATDVTFFAGFKI